MIAASRRSFITGLVALVAAPAIVRAGSLMPVNSSLVPMTLTSRMVYDGVSMRKIVEYAPGQAYVPLDVAYGSTGQWSSEECRVMMERQIPYELIFEADDAETGRTLRIRLPNDFVVSDGPGARLEQSYRYIKTRRTLESVLVIPDSLALAAAAVAIAPVVLAKPVTRRFWGG